MSSPEQPLQRPEVTDDLVAEIAARLHRVEATVAARNPDAVVVVATKGHPIDVAIASARAGARDLGESYAQELLAKLDHPSPPDFSPNWHFIGRLQSNKVRKLAGRVHLWQSLDRPSVIKEVARRDPGAAVLLQVDFAAEPQKGGCEPGDVEGLLELATSLELEVRGLMTMGPTGPPELAAPGFAALARLADTLELPVRSMGMSADLDVALDAGSTMVRVGSAIAGPRPAR